MSADGARAQPLGQLAADVHLDLGVADGQLLHVRVDRDEVDVGDARVDHPVERVQAGAADSDHADDREVGGRCAFPRPVQARRGLGQGLE